MPYVQVNGHDIHYVVDDHTDAGAVPETVFMQHFIFGSAQQFHRWTPTLSRDYRLIRMDRWGNGLSSTPPMGHEFTLEGVLSDFDAFLDAMYLDKVHYVGVSLGGVLGAAYAATRPDRVKSLVLTSSPCWIKPPTQKGWAREGYPDGSASVHALGSETWALLGWIRGMSPDASPVRVMTAQKLAQQTGLMQPHTVAALQKMVSQRSFDITPLLADIKAPTLLLSPDNSANTAIEEQNMMRDTIPNCEQIVFEDASHYIANDQPDRCAKAALEFIRRHSG